MDGRLPPPGNGKALVATSTSRLIRISVHRVFMVLSFTF
jgi:hypothetical protein